MHEDDEFDPELMKDVGWKTKRIHQSPPPVRWIANLFGLIASEALWQTILAEEKGIDNKARFYARINKMFQPMHTKYGTFYRMYKNGEY